MQDLPRTSGNTFIIASKLQRNGTGALIIPSAPNVKYGVIVTSKTGIASAVGGLDNSAVSISPVVTDGVLSWNIQGKAQGVYGRYSFTCTITTNGSDESESDSSATIYESATVTFTFHVMLWGEDQINSVRTFYLQVGDELPEQSVKPAGLCEFHDLAASSLYELRHGSEGMIETYTDGGITRTRFVGYDSGIWVAPEYTTVGTSTVMTDVKVRGVARRPGVYVLWVYLHQWPEGGQYTTLPTPFMPGKMNAACVIFSIYDTPCADGAIVIPVEAGSAMTPFRRCYHYTGSAAEAKHLAKVTFRPGGWFARYVENEGTLQERWFDYQLVLDAENQRWKLQAREYEPEEAVPAWGDVDTASNPSMTVTDPETQEERTVYATMPPVHGWTFGTWRADVAFYLQRPAQYMDTQGGFYTEIGDDMYQQRPLWTPQYEGIAMPPEWRQNHGRIVSDTDASERLTVAGSVIPYAPPATEKIGSTVVRDPALIIATNLGSIPLNIASDSDLRVNGYGIFPFYHDHRRFTPANGSGGDIEYAVGVPMLYYHVDRKKDHVQSQDTNGEGAIFDRNDREYILDASYRVSGQVTLGPLQTRNGPEMTGMFFFEPDFPPQVHIEQKEEEHTHWLTGWLTYMHDHMYRRSVARDMTIPATGSCVVMLYPASGIRYETPANSYGLPRHASFTTAAMAFSGECATVITSYTRDQQGDPENPEPAEETSSTEPGTWSAGSQFNATFANVCGAALTTGDYGEYSGTHTFSRLAGAWDDVYDEDTDTWSAGPVTSWEHTLEWTGSTIRRGAAAVSGSGTFHHVIKENGVTTSDTIVDDPNKILFDAALAAVKALARPTGQNWTDSTSEREEATVTGFGENAIIDDESSSSN